MATLKEMSEVWVQEVLELFNSIMESKVVIEENKFH